MGTADGSTASGVGVAEHELLSILRQRERAGDVTAVVRLVERWAEQGDLPREASLAAGRALLDLRLMDRAVVRLKDLVEAEDTDALTLTAELYLQRGWPGRAARVVERLRQLSPGPAVDELARRSAEPPVEPPANSRELEREGSPEQLVALAERFMATGSFLRARGILERARRADPSLPRVDQLLWGLHGDLGRKGETLAELVEELRALDENTDWDTAEHTDVGYVPTATELPTAELEFVPAPAAAFPTLFRRPARGGLDIDELDDDDEPTVTAVLATSEELRESPGASATDHGIPMAEKSGDTAIMAIIPGPGGGLGHHDGPAHRARPDAPKMRDTLDLKAWQRSMGVEPATDEMAEEDAPQPSRDEDFLEEEDQEVVVMTRRERPPEPAPASGPRKPMEVIERFPQPLFTPPPELPASALESVPSPSPSLSRSPGAAPAAVRAPPVDSRGPPTRGVPAGRLLVAVGLAAVTLAAMAWLALQVIHHLTAANLFRDAESAIGAGDPASLSGLSARLSEEVGAGRPPLAARQAALAEVSVVLWDEVTGDPADLAAAEANLDAARDNGAAASELALTDALIALARGDLGRAEQARAGLDLDTDLGRFTAARVAFDAGRIEEARGLWERRPFAPDAVRFQQLGPQILHALGDPAARTGAIGPAGHPLVLIAALEAGDNPDAVAQQVESWPPRLRARAYVAMADQARRSGDIGGAQSALESALASDATYAPALYRRASDALVQNRVLEAALMLSVCLDARTYDPSCLRGEVQALLDLDRVDEARAAATLAADAQTGDLATVLDAWVALSEGDPERARERSASVGHGPYAGLAAYVEGLALWQRGAPEADARLAATVTLLKSSTDPLDRIIAARAAAERADTGPAADIPTHLREAFSLASLDPEVHVSLARAYAARGDPTRATYHYQRAVELGGEHAVAWHAQASWDRTSARAAQARASLERYLSLGPSGPRARMARAELSAP